MARPTDCTPEVIEAIADAVRIGCTYRLACQSVGITAGTLSEWKAKGEAGEEPYRTFSEALSRAEGEHARKLSKVLDNFADGTQEGLDPRVRADAAKFMLERRHPRDYGRTVQEVEHTGSVGVVRVELPELPADASAEERRALLRSMLGR
jgi:hypothetical protein